MEDRLAMTSPAAGALKLRGLVDAARAYAAAARAESTHRAYRADFRHFDGWCLQHGLRSLPASPETVGLYAVVLADEGRAVATIRRRFAAIAKAHKLAGEPSPITAHVRELEGGIRRKLGVTQKQAKAVLPEDLRAMVEALPNNLRGKRDRAMLVLGFAGAFRGSELVALDVDNLCFASEGLEVMVRRSKTDQEGQGRVVAIPYGAQLATCPVRATQAWLQALGEPNTGPLFREMTPAGATKRRASDRAVDRLVKRAAERVGLKGVSAHSLRAGLATAAYLSGKSDRAIKEQGRWSSTASVNRYIRDGRLWKSDNAAGGIGL